MLIPPGESFFFAKEMLEDRDDLHRQMCDLVDAAASRF